jgi:phosphoglycolate phosphatase
VNRLALFDCDGTLVDSQHNICEAMTMCFVDAGLPAPDPARTRRVVGLSLVEAVGALMPEADPDLHAQLAGAYKAAFQKLRAEARVSEPLFPGIAQVLAALEPDWLLGVATGKSARGLRLCLDHHGIAERFVTLQTADYHPSKPHPAMALAALAEAGADPAVSVMIGDTSFDMALGKAAGMMSIGVAWGYHEQDELIAAGADHIAESPAMLAALLKEMA